MIDFKKQLEQNNVILSDEKYELYAQNPVAQKLIPILDVFEQTDLEKYGKILSGLIGEISVTVADYLMFDYTAGEINIDEEFEHIIQTYAYVNNRLIRAGLAIMGDVNV